MKITKKISLGLIFLLFIVGITYCCFFNNGITGNASETTYSFDIETQYCLGESVDIPTIRNNDVNYKVSMQYVNGDAILVEKTFESAVNANYKFNKTGQYYLIYEIVRDDSCETLVHPINVVNGVYIEIGDIPTVVSPRYTIEIPGVYLVDGDSKIECSKTVKLPDGTTVTPSDKFTFEMAGRYQLVCSAESDGRIYSKTKIIDCTINYQDLFIGNVVDIENNVDSPEYVNQTENGVKITAKTGSVIRFANQIDLNELNPDANLFGFIPLVNNSAPDYKSFGVRLTDVYDDNNVLEFFYRDADGSKEYFWNYALSYLMVGFNGKRGGYQNGAEINYYPYGTVVTNSFNGGLYPGYDTTDVFAVQYDYSDGKIYTSSKSGAGNKSLVMDLNDRNFSGESFKGFTTGEVYIDFFFPTMTKSGQVLITEIAGVKLDGEKVVDNVKPVIYVNTHDEYLLNGFPNAMAGEKYNVPSAYAIDMISGKCEVKISVVDSNGSPVDIIDGAFVPETAGVYILKYIASDVYGNEKSESFYIQAKQTLPERKVEFAETDLRFYAGKAFKMPEISVYGRGGVVEYTYTAEFDGRMVEPDVNGYFLFNKVGTLRFNVNVNDYFGGEMLILSLPVNATPQPVIEVYNVPISAFRGQTIKLPDFTATDYLNNRECYKSVYVNGQALGNSLTYTVKQTDTKLFVEYVAIVSGYESVKSFEITVLNSKAFDEVIITTDDVQTEVRGQDGVGFSSDSDFGIKMPAPLSFDQLEISFKLLAEETEHVELYFHDFATRTRFIKLSVYPAGVGMVNVFLNDSTLPYAMQGDFNDVKSTLSFVFQNGKVYNNGAQVLTIDEYSNGDVFDDFKGSDVLVEIKMCNVEDTSSLILYRVANQSFMTIGSFSSDLGPVINYSYRMSNKVVRLNQDIIAYSAIGNDVFTGYERVNVVIKTPSNAIVYQGEIVQDFIFKALELGKYTITYSSTDYFGNSSEEFFVCQVIDSEPPVITVLRKINDTYKAGEEILIPGGIATDNIDGDVELKAYLLDGYYNYTSLTLNQKIALKEGKYKIVYFVYDSEFNLSRVEYSFEVVA